MKIVINIPEKYLNSNIIDVTLFTGANNTITDVNVENEYAEFQILPKGHGRLIDADNLDTSERGNNSQRTMWWNIDCIVKDAPTIIDADK